MPDTPPSGLSENDMSDDESNDLDLFLQAVGEVKPVPHDRVVHERPALKPIPQKFIEDEKAVLKDMLSDEYFDADLQPGEVLAYCGHGIQKSTYKKFRRGEYRREAELDLHGYTGEQARKRLAEFLTDARRHDCRCVSVIHGKGLSSNEGPILKTRVNSWLRQRGDVLAFHSARPNDGGTGAVYVLLKSNRNN